MLEIGSLIRTAHSSYDISRAEDVDDIEATE
jgi:hypothetical protein